MAYRGLGRSRYRAVDAEEFSRRGYIRARRVDQRVMELLRPGPPPFNQQRVRHPSEKRVHFVGVNDYGQLLRASTTPPPPPPPDVPPPVPQAPIAPMEVPPQESKVENRSNGNGKREPTAPLFEPPPFGSSVKSTRSAPGRSPERLRRLAENRQQHLTSVGKSNDDSRLQLLERASRVLNFETHGPEKSADLPELPPMADEDMVEIPRPRRLTGFASISVEWFEKSSGTRYRVYVIQELQNDRLLLRTPGPPHFEVIVIYKKATFNNIPMTEFNVSEVMHPGDNVLLEKFCQYYDSKSGTMMLRGLAISFPQFSLNPLKKELYPEEMEMDPNKSTGDRWLTHGWLKVLDEDVANSIYVVTESYLGDDPNRNIVIKAPQRAFVYDDPMVDEESTVVVRAMLTHHHQQAFCGLSGTKNTPWVAECVAVSSGGVRSGVGTLIFGYRGRIKVISCSDFGYVYIPSTLLANNREVGAAKAKTKLEFEATLNRVCETDTSREASLARPYKWRAVYVKVAKDQTWVDLWKLRPCFTLRFRDEHGRSVTTTDAETQTNGDGQPENRPAHNVGAGPSGAAQGEQFRDASPSSSLVSGSGVRSATPVLPAMPLRCPRCGVGNVLVCFCAHNQ